MVRGDALETEDDENPDFEPKTSPRAKLVSEFPISEASKAQFLALFGKERDPLAGKSESEKRALLKRTSYREFLLEQWGCNAEVADFFQGRPLGYFGLGADAVSAEDLRNFGYPGFRGLGLRTEKREAADEPYIYHFPDGNASLTRMLVRQLIPGTAPGKTMDDIVRAQFNYSKLDLPENRVRIRLNSTCVNVADGAKAAKVAYMRDGELHAVEAKHVVLACFHTMIPYIMPSLPEEQREALARNVKTPLVYTNVLIRNWRAWTALKLHSISAPMSFHATVKLDFPVSLGGYVHPRDPDGPVLLHLGPCARRAAQAAGGARPVPDGPPETSGNVVRDFESRIRDDLDRMLGSGGFSSSRDIAAITVNRWSHGYSYVANSLFDPEDYEQSVLAVARAKSGRVAIANTDAGGDAWAHYAIDQAARAVGELSGTGSNLD